jgi:hypothetical protein
MEAVSSTESHNGVMLSKLEAITWHVVCGEKKAAKRNLRDIYAEKWRYHSATKFSRYDATGASKRWGCQRNPCIWFWRPAPLNC